MSDQFVKQAQPKRTLSPYEETQLARAGLSKIDRSQLGTTPIEYITGTTEFCGFQFLVSPVVLIPRLETEELVTHVVNHINKRRLHTSEPLTVREVGTGSGAISIAVLLTLLHDESNLPLPHFTLSDISLAALAIAQKNRDLLVPQPLQSHFTLCNSDLLDDSPPLTTEKYDFLIANLPYIPTERILHLDESVKDHEPLIALDGGTDGFGLIRKLLLTAQDRLKPTGEIWLEVDHTHTLEFMAKYYSDILSLYTWQTFSDSLDHHRFLQGTLKKTT